MNSASPFASLNQDASPATDTGALANLSVQADNAAGVPSASWYYNQLRPQNTIAASAFLPQSTTTQSITAAPGWINWFLAAGAVVLLGGFVYVKYYRGK